MKYVRRITFHSQRDLQCAYLGTAGFSATLIALKTGLSKAAVYYRLRMVGVRIRDYREGRNAIAQYVIQQVIQKKSYSLIEKRVKQLQKGK